MLSENIMRNIVEKRRHPDRPPPVFCRVVDGKLNFLKMVCGEKSPIYRKYASQYNCLIGKPFPQYFDDPIKEIASNLWILECERRNLTRHGIYA